VGLEWRHYKLRADVKILVELVGLVVVPLVPILPVVFVINEIVDEIFQPPRYFDVIFLLLRHGTFLTCLSFLACYLFQACYIKKSTCWQVRSVDIHRSRQAMNYCPHSSGGLDNQGDGAPWAGFHAPATPAAILVNDSFFTHHVNCVHETHAIRAGSATRTV
jgi:hypothetical protein